MTDPLAWVGSMAADADGTSPDVDEITQVLIERGLPITPPVVAAFVLGAEFGVSLSGAGIERAEAAFAGLSRSALERLEW